MELIKENKPSLKKRYKIIPMVLFILGIILTCISMDILYTFKEKEQDILLTGYLVDEFQSNHIPYLTLIFLMILLVSISEIDQLLHWFLLYQDYNMIRRILLPKDPLSRRYYQETIYA